METAVTKLLDEKNIDYKLIMHKSQALTCELAAAERGCRISQIVKTMVGKDLDGILHICMIPGDKRLKLKKVRKEAGGIKVNLMSPDEITQSLGLTVGAISPFNVSSNSKFYMDPTVLEEEYIDISSGDPKAGIELKSDDLKSLIEVKICDIISNS